MHLPHYLTPMGLYSNLADAEICCDLLVQSPAHHISHYFLFAPCQVFVENSELGMLLLTLQPDPIPCMAEGNGIKQILVPKWLRKELDGAGLHSPDRHRDIAVSRDKDDRKMPL